MLASTTQIRSACSCAAGDGVLQHSRLRLALGIHSVASLTRLGLEKALNVGTLTACWMHVE